MRSVLPVAAALLGVACACAQPPSKELAMTSARVELARGQEAAVFAPDRFAEAETSLEEASRRIDAGEYRSAIRALAHATQMADEAYFRASAERTVAERRLAQLTFELDGLLDMAAGRGAREKAPGELQSLETRVGAVRELAREGHLLVALEAGAALKPELLALEQRFRPEPH